MHTFHLFRYGGSKNVTTDTINYGMNRRGGKYSIFRSDEEGHKWVLRLLVLSPMIWLLVANTILMDFKNSGFKTEAYEEDMAILASGKFLCTLSESKKWDLGVNPTETELVLFTRKYKIPSFRKPRLNKDELVLSEEAEHR